MRLRASSTVSFVFFLINDLTVYFLIKFSIYEKFIVRDFNAKTLKMVWNVRVLRLNNLNVYISEIICLYVGLKFGMEVNMKNLFTD